MVQWQTMVAFTFFSEIDLLKHQPPANVTLDQRKYVLASDLSTD